MVYTRRDAPRPEVNAMWLANEPFCPVSAPIIRSATRCASTRTTLGGTTNARSNTGFSPRLTKNACPRSSTLSSESRFALTLTTASTPLPDQAFTSTGLSDR
jgi:hypothetical protein